MIQEGKVLMSFGHDCGPEPPEPTEKALWRFASLSNWGNLHPNDDDRFYEFIVIAVRNGTSWKREDVEDHLRKFGMPESPIIQQLGKRYWSGTCALVKKQRMEFGDREPVY
jgi:hypothetical protein